MSVLDALPRIDPMLAALPPAPMPPDRVPTGALHRCRVPLLGGKAQAVYRRRGRWAISDGGVRADAGSAELALSEYLEVLRARRLRPLILGVADRSPYTRRGLYTHRYASGAVVDLAGGDPATAAGEAPRDLEAADRSGVQVVPYRPAHAAQVARFAPGASRTTPDAEAWVAVQADGTVVGIAVWSLLANPGNGTGAAGALAGAVRRLEVAAVHPQAPAEVNGALVAEAVDEYSRRGESALELGWMSAGPWWPPAGPAAPAALLPVLARLRPRWQDRWLAVPEGWQLPAAAWALG